MSDDNPGFGASDMHHAGEIIAGNTFDYASVHGKAVLNAGYPFYSCSNESFESDSTYRHQAWTVDLICGKQMTTTVGSGMQQKYTVFSSEMQDAIRSFTSAGGNILVSGANIGTDIWDSIYPVQIDSTFRENSIKFATDVLGYKWMGNFASRRAEIRGVRNNIANYGNYSYYNEPNSLSYSVESPDGLVPSSHKGKTVLRYADTGISAGVCHDGKGYRTACFGFPVEALKDSKKIDEIITITLEYFNR